MFEIRPALFQDAPGIAEVNVASWKAAYSGILPESFLKSLSVAERQSGWEQKIKQTNSTTLVATVGERVIGFAFFGPVREEERRKENAGEVYAIYVHPEFWEQKAGAELLSKAMERLSTAGHSEADIWVLRKNTRARGFYKHFGFRDTGAEKFETRSDGTVFDEVRYSKELA